MSTVQLLNSRVIFVTGKGGSGKTTVTGALAMAFAKNHKKVLIAETHENDALGTLFGKERLIHEPTKLAGRIWGVRIDYKEVLEEYIKKYVNTSFIASQITSSGIFEHLAVAAPGLKEIMTLSEIWRFEQRPDPKEKEFLFDHIIVDSPATGHGLSLLRVPSALKAMFQAGPLAAQTQWVQDMLQDPDRTSLLVVALPEELPVNEALELERKAENDLNINVALTLVNMVYPEFFTPDEVSVIENLDKIESLKHHPCIEAARRHISRRKLQRLHIRRLVEEVESPVLEIPFYDTNHLCRKHLADLAEHMQRELFKLSREIRKHAEKRF